MPSSLHIIPPSLQAPLDTPWIQAPPNSPFHTPPSTPLTTSRKKPLREPSKTRLDTHEPRIHTTRHLFSPLYETAPLRPHTTPAYRKSPSLSQSGLSIHSKKAPNPSKIKFRPLPNAASDSHLLIWKNIDTKNYHQLPIYHAPRQPLGPIQGRRIPLIPLEKSTANTRPQARLI